MGGEVHSSYPEKKCVIGLEFLRNADPKIVVDQIVDAYLNRGVRSFTISDGLRNLGLMTYDTPRE